MSEPLHLFNFNPEDIGWYILSDPSEANVIMKLHGKAGVERGRIFLHRYLSPTMDVEPEDKFHVAHIGEEVFFLNNFYLRQTWGQYLLEYPNLSNPVVDHRTNPRKQHWYASVEDFETRKDVFISDWTPVVVGSTIYPSSVIAEVQSRGQSVANAAAPFDVSRFIFQS